MKVIVNEVRRLTLNYLAKLKRLRETRSWHDNNIQSNAPYK